MPRVGQAIGRLAAASGECSRRAAQRRVVEGRRKRQAALEHFHTTQLELLQGVVETLRMLLGEAPWGRLQRRHHAPRRVIRALT